MRTITCPNGDLHFKIRFNTAHGDSDLYWRVIVDDVEYLMRSVTSLVHTFSDSSFDKKAGVIKFHIAGICREMVIDEVLNATFR